jgi:hypothetical protein
MRYIKLFELFSIKASYPYEEVEAQDSNKYVIYSFKTDKYIYDVIFEKFKDGWQAEHKIGNPYTYAKLKLTSDNVFKITSTVMHITQKFLEEKTPNYLVILYVGTPDETEDPNNKDITKEKINKRARLQSNYLKKIEGYTPKYYFRINPHQGTNNRGNVETCCIFYRNGYDITDIEKEILSYNFSIT